MLRALVLSLVAAGTIGLAASATPANARIAAGVTAPAVETNKVDVRRCHHHRWSSRWHCRHQHWNHHRHWHAQPFYYQPHRFHGHRHHRRWQSRQWW
jgi:hypothetical protein